MLVVLYGPFGGLCWWFIFMASHLLPPETEEPDETHTAAPGCVHTLGCLLTVLYSAEASSTAAWCFDLWSKQ